MADPRLKTRTDYHNHSWDNLLEPAFRNTRWYALPLFCLIGGFVLGLSYSKLFSFNPNQDQIALTKDETKIAHTPVKTKTSSRA